MSPLFTILMTAAALILGSLRPPSQNDRRPSQFWAAARAAGVLRSVFAVLVVVLAVALYIVAEIFHLARFVGHGLAVACDSAAGWVEAVGRRASVGVRA